MAYFEKLRAGEDDIPCADIGDRVHIRGRIMALTTRGPCGLSYFIYRPRQNFGRAEQVIFSIHGYTRNALQHAVVLQELAEEKGMTIVVPHFTRKKFRRYQQVRSHGQNPAPDMALMELIHELREIENLDLSTIRAVGYSGGGQFLHRLIMLHPDLVDRAVLFAPGWYTMPYGGYPYPLGFGESNSLGDRPLSLDGFNNAEVLVLVGDDDTGRSSSLNQDKQIDFLQGRTRVIRAQTWVRAMNAELPSGCSIKLQLLKGLRHGFRRNFETKGYGRLVFDQLLDEVSAPPETEEGQSS